MKTGRTLVELAQEIERQRTAAKDFIAPAPAMAMVVADKTPTLALDPAKQFGINELAHGQLAEYVGIPKAYYDTMRTKAPDLLATNVNRWFHDKGTDRRLVRTLDGNVRGLLSDKYRVGLSNFGLAEAVLPVIADMTIVSCEITERRMYIKAFDPKIEAEIRKMGSDPAHTFLKDVCFAAITISNSEVGYGALSVAAGMYTGGCTNFAAFHDSRMTKYHIGRKADTYEGEQIYELLSDKTKDLTDAAIWSQTRDVVTAALDRVRFNARIEKIQATADNKMDAKADVVKVVEVAGDTLGLTQGERKSVLSHLIKGGALSQYGLFNAVTRAAEDAESYDRASELEAIGGRVIELNRSEWERLAKAA